MLVVIRTLTAELRTSTLYWCSDCEKCVVFLKNIYLFWNTPNIFTYINGILVISFSGIMEENGDSAYNGTATVGNQNILEVVAENQVLIRGLFESLPATIATATAAALRQSQCVPKQQLGEVIINNR